MTEINTEDIHDATSSITNNDALREKIHELHNYMRNNGIGYGMNALKVFNLLYGLKKIDELNLYDKIGLTDENCKWSYLVKLANNQDKVIVNVINNIVNKIYDIKQVDDLIGYDIPRDLIHDVFNHLINEIDNIPKLEKSSGELLSGKIYEYFVGRDQSAISELGAYFTNRRIVNHILNKIKIDLNSDGSIPKMIDMFGGSGGFTLGYMNYLNSNFKIDWNSQLNNIYHFDINQDVIKSVALEFFCLSNGIIPNIDNTSGNLRRINSFKWNYGENKFKLILTNPPYGGDKIGTSAKKEKRDKIIKYIENEINEFKDKLSAIVNDKKIKSIDKLIELVPDINKDEVKKIKAREFQLAKLKKEEKIEKENNEALTVNVKTCSVGIQKFAGKYKLTGKDKEACSLMLIMDLLDINGIAVGVLKEGLFFDGKYSDLRRVLIENFNVKEIISVPQNQFENTSTKTSIVIFNNDADIKTSVINFSELIVDTYDKDEFIEINNEIFLKFNKGDIKEVREVFITSVSVNQILANENCSLNSKDYNKVSIECGDDFKLVRIGDICYINLNKNFKSYEEYKFIQINNINNGSITDYSIIKRENLPANAKNIINYNDILISSVRPNSSKVIIITKSLNDIEKYLFSSAMIKLTPINNSNYHGYYVYFIVLILSNNFQKTLCNGSSYPRFKASQLENLEIPIPKTQELIDYWVDKISTPFNLKQEKEKRFKELEEEIKMKIKDIQENSDCEDVKLGDISNINSGKFLPKNEIIKGLFNIIGGGKIIGKHNISNRTGNDIVLTRVGAININYIIEPYYLTDNGLAINSNIYNNKLLYYYLIINFTKLSELYNGSNQKVIKKTDLENFTIKIPKDKSLIDNLEPLFNEVEELQKEIKELDETYNNYLQELAKSAIKNYDSNDYTNHENNENDNSSEKEEVKSDKSNKSLTVSELKEQCKSLGIKGYSKKTKEELIEIIKNHK